MDGTDVIVTHGMVLQAGWKVTTENFLMEGYYSYTLPHTLA